MKRSAIIILAFFGLACGATAFAGEPAEPADSMSHRSMDEVLQTVVVTATRTPKVLKDVPIITRVITSDEISRVDATNISDLLQSELPGFEISYTMSQQAALNLNGFGGNSVLFLVDGERLAGETLDNVDYSRLNLENVDRIEIVKGAASSLYGSNAVGGVINIISKTSSEPWSVNVNQHYGSHNELRTGVTVGFTAGRFTSVTNAQLTSINTIPLENESNDYAYSALYGNKTWTVKEKLVYRATDKLTFTGRAGYFFRERESSTTLPDRYRDFSAGLKMNYVFTDHNDLEVAYTFDQYDKSNYVVSSGYDVRDYSNVQNTVRALYNHTFAGKYTMTVGGDFMRDYLMSYQFAEDEGSRHQYVADGFAQIDMNFTDRFNVIAGARYDYYSDARLSHVSPKLGLMYKLGKNWALRGSYAGGFRAPTLKEMYMSFDMAGVFMIYGNNGLKPEKSHNFSLSGEFTKKNYNVTASGFYNIVNDRITTVWNQTLIGLDGVASGAMQYMNISRVNVAGADVNVSARYDFGLSARLSYTYTHEDFTGGEEFSATRPHAANLRVEYEHRASKNYAFTVGLNGRYLSKVKSYEYTSADYDTVEEVVYEGYTIWKLTFTQNIWRGINLILAVDNLFNYKPKTYYSNSLYTTGTTFAGTLSLDIEKMFKKKK